MKIVMYGKFHLNSPNGTYQAIRHLSEALYKYDNNIEITIISPDNTYSEDEIKEARKIGINLVTLKGFFKFFKYIKVIKQIKPDIIHYQYVRYPSMLITALLNKYYFKIRQVISLHDGYSLNFFKKSKLKKIIYFYLIDKNVIKLMDSIHFITEREKQEFEQISKIKNLNYRIIPNIYVYKYIDKLDSEKKRKDNLLFGYLGRLDIRHKALDYQIKLVKNLCKYNSNLIFELHGTDVKGSVEKLKQIGKDVKCIKIEKPIFGKEKEKFLKEIDVFMHASRWELFGYSILEAIDAGAHVVISKNSDISIYLKNLPFCTMIEFEEKNDIEKLNNIIKEKKVFKIYKRERKRFLNKFYNKKLILSYINFYKEN